VKKLTAFYASILAGLALPASAFSTAQYPKLEGSDLTRLRRDVSRVGKDFSTVIARENGKVQSPKSE
jgi:hypothetical protein